MELLVLRVVAFFELLRFDDDFLTFPRNTFRGEKELPRKCLLSPQKMMEVVSVVSVAPPVSVSAAVGAPVPVPAVAVAAAVGVGTLLPGDLLGDLKNTNLHKNTHGKRRHFAPAWAPSPAPGRTSLTAPRGTACAAPSWAPSPGRCGTSRGGSEFDTIK